MINCYHHFRGACCLYHQESDCENFNFPTAVHTYIYTRINIFLCVSKSAEFVFTTNIGANCYRGFVTTDNINRNRTAATRGTKCSITESPVFWWWWRNWKIMRSNLLSCQLLGRLHGNRHQNSNWFCVGLIMGEQTNESGKTCHFF